MPTIEALTELRPTDSIIIPPERQREAATPDDALLASIERDGLLNPIAIHSDGTLVAGERRLRAHLQLKLSSIRCTVLENLPADAAMRIELSENLARKQLSWQEETKAIAGYHAVKLQAYAGWTNMGTGTDLGISDSKVGRALLIAGSLHDPEISGCQTFQAAFNVISSRAQRARIAAQSRGLEVVGVADLMPKNIEGATKEERTKALFDSISTSATVAETLDDFDKDIKNIEAGRLAEAALRAEQARETTSDLVINADFLEWAADYSGPKFDVLHIDFPYGKGYKGSNTRRTGKVTLNPLYLDDPDIYFELVDGLLKVQDNIAFPAAHCIFWFDMLYYQWTIDQFTAAGWKLVQPFPLVWTKGHTGVAADPQRRPRHCYETALMFSRGDRRISKLTNDHFECANEQTKLHTSQKPQAMLRHFLSLVVDEHSAVLDPTCGSGSALVAAMALKAPRVLGIELDPSNAEVARFLLQSHHAKEQGK